jgi:hypothetical protein
MSNDRITRDELQEVLAAVDPAAVLMAPRYLRRVVRRERELPGLGLAIPHRKTYVATRERARDIVRPDESPELHRSRVPPTVMLLSATSGSRLAQIPRQDVLLGFSRRLFHATIDLHFKTTWLPSHSRAAVRGRIDEIGQAEFDEIRAVLRDENYLFPPYDDPQVYAEFCAVFFELERFAPGLLRHYFPTIADLARVGELLRRDVPVDDLFKRSKLPGAVIPPVGPIGGVEGSGHEESQRPKVFDPWIAPSLQRRRMRPLRFRFHRLRALRAARRGNDVRCALQNVAAYRVAPFRAVDAARTAADEALVRLAQRLSKGIHLEERGADDLERLLPTLLPSAVEGAWNESAKLLFDLQNACVDLERDHYDVDLWSWLFSFGRTPVRRPLPMLPEVLAARHLRSAARRVGRVPLPPALRQEWLHVVRTAAEAADRVVRTKFGPVLDEALRANGFSPTSAVDRVALDKMVGELLDVVVARGRFSLGDLRDVVARNDFKLADVRGVGEFWHGDALLRSNRALSKAFDGVYRGGEFYLRWLLQLTSLTYGTRTGRLFTKHVALPLGGSYMVVEGLQHTLFVLLKLALRLPYDPPFANAFSFVTTAAIIYACIHNANFAAKLWAFVRGFGRGLKRVFIDWPAQLLQWPSIQRFIHSAAFVLFRRAVLFPLAVAFAVGEVTPAVLNTFLHAFWPHQILEIAWPQPPAAYLLVAFCMAAVVFVSPLGRRIENFVFDRVHWTWQHLRYNLFPGLVRAIMEFFRFLLDALERLLYAVDERLRFHAGDTRLSLVTKAIVGAVWRIIENFVRALVTLAVEPQVNPVKHFPVVTVSHKIMIPTAPSVTRLLTPVMGTEYAVLTTGALLTVLPGVCGFLAWELLTNWRLYEATRPDTLKPRAFGSHGETMVRMLRPGFHSGTVPKLFARIRRARRAELRGGSSAKFDRLHDELHHVADSIERFVRRELLRTMAEHPAWCDEPLIADRVTLASNRIVVVVAAPELAESPLKFAFEEQSGWLAAHVVDSGWLVGATDEQRNAFEWALAGFYKRCGVGIVREQLEAVLKETVPNVDGYDVADRGLVVWPSDSADAEFVYDLAAETDLVLPTPLTTTTRPLSLRAAVFKRIGLTWVRWSYFWNAAAEAGPLPWRLLPNGAVNVAPKATAST